MGRDRSGLEAVLEARGVAIRRGRKLRFEAVQGDSLEGELRVAETTEPKLDPMAALAAKVQVTYGEGYKSDRVSVFAPEHLREGMATPDAVFVPEALQIIEVSVLPASKQVRLHVSGFKCLVLLFEGAEFHEDWLYSKSELETALQKKVQDGSLKVLPGCFR